MTLKKGIVEKLSDVFRKKTGAFLGIDLGTHSAKIVAFSKVNRQLRLETCLSEPLKQGAWNEHGLVNEKVAAETIEYLLSLSRTQRQFAVIAMSNREVITKRIKLPSDLYGNDLETQVHVEAKRHITYPIEDVMLDFDIIDRPADSSADMEVLLSACRRESVQRKEDAVALAGLRVMAVDTESLALERACRLISHQIPADDLFAIVHVGHTSTLIQIIRQGAIIDEKESTVSGKKMTESIQRQYNITFDEADRKKIEGALPEDYRKQLLPEFFASLSGQIERSFAMYHSNSTVDSKIQQIILSGGSSLLPKAAAFLQKHLNMPVSLANPFFQMEADQWVNVKKANASASAFFLASGIAMREEERA